MAGSPDGVVRVTWTEQLVAWVFLAVAIVAELFGTLGLRQIAATPTWWSILLITAAYAVSFAAMAVALRHLNVGVVYAVWSAVGIAAISIAGVLFFGDRLNGQGIAGLLVIVAGVVVLVSSGSVTHG